MHGRLSLAVLPVVLVLALESPAVAQNDPLTLGQLATLAGTYAPTWVSGYSDLNLEDRFATSIDVYQMPVNLQIGESTVPVTLQLYIREAVVGAFRIEGPPADPATLPVIDDQLLYDAAVADLLASTVGPAGNSDIGKTTATWAFDDNGSVEITRGGDKAGLLLTVVTADMAASYEEFWASFAAALAIPGQLPPVSDNSDAG
jgi:hypothetical protein